MRKTKLTFDEIQTAEEASENRRRSRAQGFKKMHERDKAVQLLSNGAVMLWYVPKELAKNEFTFTQDNGEKMDVTIYPPPIPEDSFALDLKCEHCGDKRRYLFRLDEFRKYLRWA